MPLITYVNADDSRQTQDVPVGESVMEGAVSNGIEGIVALCGGNMQCATCHVYVDPAQLSLLPPMSEDEDSTLDSVVAERKPNSRLSCQIRVTPELDGLVVNLPPVQM